MSIPIEQLLSTFLRPSEQQEYTPQILEAMARRLGEKNPQKWKWLGEGSNAQVYWLNDKKKILKITRDESDANASIILQHKPDRSLLHVHDVFEIPTNYKTVLGIVAEKLSPLGKREEKRLQGLLAFLFDLGIKDHPTMENVLELRRRMFYPDPDKYPTDKYIKDYYKRHRITEEAIDLWETWAKALDARDILWKDFTTYNVMSRGRNAVISDLGYNNSPPQQIPELQV